MTKPFVVIVMGSENDLEIVNGGLDILQSFNVSFEVRILSAHRSPELLKSYILETEQRGCAVYIAAAGLAAHLAGAVAAHTIKPVIGIPLDTSSLGGLDSLLSTVQMPAGIPVACTSLGKAGAKNAALLAIEILAIQDEQLTHALSALRKAKREELDAANKKLQAT